MAGKLKIEIIGDDENMLEVYEEGENLTFAMYPGDEQIDPFAVSMDKGEFVALLRKLIDLG